MKNCCNKFVKSTSFKIMQRSGNSSQISVADFYAGKSVFITGGSGFIGKVFIEKLLYSCNSIDTIYVLLRKKKDQTPEETIKKLLQNEVFERVSKECPNNFKKVVPIVGDLIQPELGLNDYDRKLITNKVSIVFHVAATIKFNEPIKVAMKINVEGTQSVLKLCHQMPQLKALVHLSTAYSNTDRKEVDEVVYPPPATLDEVYAFLNKHGAKDITELLNGRPNTYTYTKGLAENIVLRNHGDLPTVIVRPSIVTSTLREPLEGWLDNWNGPTTVVHFASLGIHRHMLGDNNYVVDLIPVDIVTNMTIVAATKCQRSKDIQVFNCCSGPSNPIIYEDFFKLYVQSAVKRGMNQLPYPRLTLYMWPALVAVLQFILTTFPAYLLDFIRQLFGKQPKYKKLLKIIRKVDNHVNFFTSHEWKFTDGNVRSLIDSMTSSDRKTFYCDPAEIHWRSYLDNYFLGVQKFLVKKKIERA